MKNEKIIKAWDKIAPNEETEIRMYKNIRQKFQSQIKSSVFKERKLKTVLIIAAIFVIFTVTVIASVPLIFKLDLPAAISQRFSNYITEAEHNIIINNISLSPFGSNTMVITEKAGSNSFKALFSDFFIVDNKGNFYGHLTNGYLEAQKDWNEDKTYTVEFFGNVPSDVEFLKLIPYNSSTIPEIIIFDGIYPEEYPDGSKVDPREYYLESKFDINILPQKFKQSEYGNVSIESCVVTDEDITITYKYDGMVVQPLIIPTDGESSISQNGELSAKIPVYNNETNSYTLTFTFNKPIPNVKDIVKGLILIQHDIKLIEDQSIIIQL